MKRNWIIFQFLALFCFFRILFGGTKGILEGYVREKETGRPLYGVNVIILGTQRGSSTDEKGFFQINNVPAGAYTVQFRMMGYRTVNYENVVIRPNLRTRLKNVEMEEIVLPMEALVVKAQRPLIQKDITGSTMRVSGARINQLPVSSFTEILPMQAGVTDEGNVRGGKTWEVLYLMDGLSVQDMVMGGVGLHIPVSAISQMEISTGGFDAEYGNALSGVVNVITKRGTNEFAHTFLAELDDLPWSKQKNRMYRVEALTSGPMKKDHLFYLFSGDLHLTDTRWWQDFKYYFSSPVSSEYSGFGKIDYHINPNMRLSVQGLFSGNKWRDYEFSWRFNLNGLPSRSRDVITGAVSWDHVLSKRTFYSLNLSYFNMRSRIGEGAKQDIILTPYEYDFFLQYIVDGNRCWWADTRQGIGILQGTVTSQVTDAHLLKSGFELHFYDIHGDIVKYEPQMTYFGKPILDEPLLNFSTQYHYYPRSGSFYIQDKWEFAGEGGVLSAGLRYDFLDPGAERPRVEWVPIGEDEYVGEVKEMVEAAFKGVLNLRAGFSAPLSEKSFIFANIGTYTQFPMFHYLYSGLDNVALRSGMSVLKGNPDLKPETNLVWEASFKYTIPWDGVLSFTLFSKQTKNQIDTKTFIPSNSRIAGDYGFAEYVNNARAEARGFEFSISKERGESFTGILSYTYMKTEGMSSTPQLGIQYFQWGFPLSSKLYYLSWDQRHTIKANLNFELLWDLTASIYAQYHSPRPYTYYPSHDGYTPIDPDLPFIPNNRRMKHYQTIDIKVSRKFTFSRLLFQEIRLYADCRNLLNQKNVLWIDSSGRTGGELGDPGAYTVGRRTRIGIHLDFK
jgi:outer membrane receptor protein involved in Fe transport